jgi:hypothetical protein
MAALTMLNAMPDSGKTSKLLETVALTNTTTQTVNKGFMPPGWAVAATFVVDITITGTTPLFDFTVMGVNAAAPSSASSPYDSADMFLIGAGWGAGITQLTTDTSSPMVTIHLSPYAPIDVTGSATADSVYSINTFLLPVMGYRYAVDGTTGNEDYNGTISVYWHGMTTFG